MKVIQLQSSNIMRLLAVDITPEGNLVMVGGKNGAGKSSVLNSIAMALGGKDLAPVEPIRAGETEASIKLDLGDLVVTRKFSREKTHTSECTYGNAVGTTEGDPVVVCKDCNCTPTFSETTSTLTVTNKDGAKYPSPQAMLNKLLSSLTFDPLAFSNLDPKPQDEVLRKVMKIDTTQIDTARKATYDERTIQHKTRDIKMAQLLKLPKHDEVPAEEISFDVITTQLKEAEGLKEAASAARKLAEAHGEKIVAMSGGIAAGKARIKQLEDQLAEEKSQLEKREQERNILNTQHQELINTANKADKAVPDTESLRARLTEANETNAKVRDNAAYLKASREIIDVENRIEELNYAITTADEDKRKMLETAKFPVAGLGLNDNGVTFNGVPFKQASTAEQLRVSVAIGLALNPSLKVLLIRSGNLLDEDSLKLVAAQAEAADAQVWMEYVTSNSNDVQVMIEDGHVKGN